MASGGTTAVLLIHLNLQPIRKFTFGRKRGCVSLVFRSGYLAVSMATTYLFSTVVNAPTSHVKYAYIYDSTPGFSSIFH